MGNENVDVSWSDDSQGVAITMGDGPGSAEKVQPSTDSIVLDSDDDLENDDVGSEDVDGEAGEDAGNGDASQDGSGDGDPDVDPAEELGEYNSEDPEVVAKFEKRYLTESGELDVEGNLSKEYFANLEKGVDGLNEATYGFLAAKGISKATVKQIEAMAKTQRDAEAASVQAHDMKLMSLAGGPDKLQAALEWGKAGGYTAAQQERFNEIMKGTDLEAKEMAVEALLGRHTRANPPQKPKVPARDATKGQGKTASTTEGFKTREEARKFRKGLKDTDVRGWETYKARFAASRFED